MFYITLNPTKTYLIIYMLFNFLSQVKWLILKNLRCRLKKIPVNLKLLFHLAGWHQLSKIKTTGPQTKFSQIKSSSQCLADIPSKLRHSCTILFKSSSRMTNMSGCRLPQISCQKSHKDFISIEKWVTHKNSMRHRTKCLCLLKQHDQQDNTDDLLRGWTAKTLLKLLTEYK